MRDGAATGASREATLLRREALRKLIHVSTAAVPLAVWFLPYRAALLLTGAGALAALGIELARVTIPPFRRAFFRRTGRLLRARERRGIAGATYMAIAYFLAVILFPRPIAVAAMLYDAIGDAAAALVGTHLGKHPTRWGKSWEGFGAGFAANLAVGLLIPGISPAAALAGAAAAAVLEFLPLPLDDNLRVTLGGGLVLRALV